MEKTQLSWTEQSLLFFFLSSFSFPFFSKEVGSDGNEPKWPQSYIFSWLCPMGKIYCFLKGEETEERSGRMEG